jgi:hypothetical protein
VFWFQTWWILLSQSFPTIAKYLFSPPSQESCICLSQNLLFGPHANTSKFQLNAPTHEHKHPHISVSTHRRSHKLSRFIYTFRGFYAPKIVLQTKSMLLKNPKKSVLGSIFPRIRGFCAWAENYGIIGLREPMHDISGPLMSDTIFYILLLNLTWNFQTWTSQKGVKSNSKSS